MAPDEAAPPLVNTSFVGRGLEDARVRDALGTGRLTTLTGPGGVGKTRLAGHVLAGHPGAAVFVGLAELRDPALLPNLVADRLGLHHRPGEAVEDTVLDHLRGRELLLVLDNCEHLVEACARFAQRVLDTCPGVVVLATSRQSLGVGGERVLPVPPLAVPERGVALAEAAGYDAVVLFVDRVRAVVPSFRLDSGNVDDVVRLCGHLDGVPLAVELAAARVRALSPGQIADRLAAGGSPLGSGPRTAPERQRTLRATLDWSHGLCTVAERAVWRRLSVFAGSFELGAAEYVCAGPGVGVDDVLGLVDALLDKSVLVRDDRPGAATARYRVLEVLREYGQERLREAGELTGVSRRHRDFFDRLTAEADAAWLGPEQVRWADRLHREQANLRAALHWSLTEPGEAGVALAMAARVDEHWTLHGRNAEARMWLDRALAAVPAHPARARALSVSALYALWQYDVVVAAARLDEAEVLADEPGRAHVTYVRALGAMLRRDFAGAADLARRAARDCPARHRPHPRWIHGVCTAVLGDVDTARTLLADLASDVVDPYYLAMAHYGQAVVEVLYGDAGAAARAARAGIEADLLLGNRFGTAHQVEALAWVHARQGEHAHAGLLFGAAATLWEAVGTSPERAGSLAVPHFDHWAMARDGLGHDRFDQAVATGRALSFEQAVRCALAPAPTRDRSALTRREHEIAVLVAEGLSNRDIAAKLVMSPRTAETHVQHVLTKLGFTRRTQIAAWIAARER
ncbi:LuxR C-terminal-related transcriptional regulator [Actinokineospora sp. PR83]|uniref:ATP-binding protein n=1 Tax=Actinokineospora sp. PR83 TaxID=2884908 RepID=UPI0027E03B60|nr:LuxR C-terminal-related transcriptional regulator [Actinokineospora sp. PR83]MCG8914539.1 LuxR C-terminal-related transcriptional regulator [Actinokineospora sp. PR83]